MERGAKRRYAGSTIYRTLLFVLVADRSSLTEAARLRGISVPSLSQTLSDLEQELGVKLYRASKSKFELTAAGQHLYSQSRDLFRSILAWERRLQTLDGNFRSTGEFRVSPDQLLPIPLNQNPIG